MTAVRIRRAAAVDADSVARVVLAARSGAGSAFPPTVHADDELVPHLLADVFPTAEVWLADRDGDSVGVLVLERDLLEQLFVLPAAQCSGIGSALLEHAKRRRPQGFDLWVFVSNRPARRFYAARGLFVVGGTSSANEEGAPDLRMRWRPTG